MLPRCIMGWLMLFIQLPDHCDIGLVSFLQCGSSLQLLEIRAGIAAAQ